MALPTLLWAVTASLCLGLSVAQSISQAKPTASGREGDTLTLPCTYRTSYSNYNLFWFKQPPTGEIIYLIHQGSNIQENARTGRYSVTFRKAFKSFSLTISKLQPRDSGVFFCALREDYLLNPLIFGGGTSLTVVPRNQKRSQPTIFLMRNESTYACLADNFYPKDVKIHMVMQGTKNITHMEHTAVTSRGKYSMVQITEFESDGRVNCTVEHEGKYVGSLQYKEKTDDPKTKTDTESTSKNSMSDSGKDDAQSNQQEAGPICREIKVRSEVVNTLSVTVLGLRVIFAKSVTLNLLLTAKYFFF